MLRRQQQKHLKRISDFTFVLGFIIIVVESLRLREVTTMIIHINIRIHSQTMSLVELWV